MVVVKHNYHTFKVDQFNHKDIKVKIMVLSIFLHTVQIHKINSFCLLLLIEIVTILNYPLTYQVHYKSLK